MLKEPDAQADQRTARRSCEEHGEYLATHIPATPEQFARWSHCPGCDAEREAKWAARMAARRAERAAALMRHSGLVGRYTRARFEDAAPSCDKHRQALHACEQFAQAVIDGAVGNLFLVGPTGNGKTWAASAIVRRVIERSPEPEGKDQIEIVYRELSGIDSPKIVTASALIREIRATWGKGGGSEDEVVRRYGTAPLLALDDVGATIGTDAEAKHLLDVVDMRSQRELPTIVTTNLALPELQRVVGARCYDRLREKARRVVFDWPSLRGTA